MIKLFNEYNSNSEYYWRIEPDEYPSSDKIIDISPEALDFVKKHYSKSKFITVKTHKLYNDQTRFTTKRFIEISTYDRCIMTIIELPDEWFYISKIDNLFYKCDQLEGLKKFILSE